MHSMLHFNAWLTRVYCPSCLLHIALKHNLRDSPSRVHCAMASKGCTIMGTCLIICMATADTYAAAVPVVCLMQSLCGR